jgi:hypothetical protein
MMGWVTTAVRVLPALTQRAKMLSDRLGWPFRSRSRHVLATELEAGGLAYVVGREKDVLRGRDSQLFLHAGLLKSKLHAGISHPLLRALAPSGTANRIVDGTLGLAGDALHIAAALECEVLGYEISPQMFSLLERGLPRLASDRAPVADAAKRVRAHLGDCATAMEQMPPDSADAVLLAPMYASPDKAAPGFDLLRGVAEHAKLSPRQIDAALRIAPRLVIKAVRGHRVQQPLEGRNARPIVGHRVDYWVVERQ